MINNYEKIKNMSIDEMANALYEISNLVKVKQKFDFMTKSLFDTFGDILVDSLNNEEYNNLKRDLEGTFDTVDFLRWYLSSNLTCSDVI